MRFVGIEKRKKCEMCEKKVRDVCEKSARCVRKKCENGSKNH